MNQEIILLSGGLDSTALTYKLHNEGKKLRAIYFDFGGKKTFPELEVAKWITKELNIPLEVANVTELNKLFLGYLPNSQIRVDGGDTSDPCPHDLIPFAKTPTGISMILSISVYYAHLTKIGKINSAFIGNQAVHYPELKEYFESFSKTDSLINRDFNRIIIEAPFSKIRKSEVIKIGLENNAPIEISWSCVRNTDIHCGECYACEERISAFEEANVQDRTFYATTGTSL